MPPYTPIALGAALYLLTGASASVREPVLERLQALLSPDQVAGLIGFLKTALKTTAAYDALWYTNSYLNNLALNNFRGADTSRWNWSQEIAVITGGASGLGKAFAEQLASRGVRVAVLDVNKPPADLKANSRITAFTCDVTNPDEVKAVATQVKETIGHPSILINNAGLANAHTIMDTPPKFLQAIMGVNVMAHWYTVHEFLPHMVEEKKGHILTIASMASFVAAPGMVDYSSTKSAVQAFHEGLQSELRAYHQCPEIHMTIVHPSWVATPMVERYRGQLQQARQPIMEPKLVVDAVINQILSCKGGQLVIGRGGSVVRRLRFLPKWLTTLMLRPMENGRRKIDGIQ